MGNRSKVSNWGYERENGPQHWAALDKAFALCCSGVEQSPIDIPAGTPVHSGDLIFDYDDTAVNILNDGRTIQVNCDAGSTLEINGQTYQLLQLHFHAPSEHTLSGNYYPAEMHLVHANAAGNLAVVTVFIAAGVENAAFAPIWENMPLEETEVIATGRRMNASDLLPSKQDFYRYNGSLTTPPCSEGVLWSVLKNPVEMSADQILAYTNIFDNTNRPVQPLNDRQLFTDPTS